MVQYIQQGNIFGRIGTNLGKALSEQVPKEVERYRLASGLKNFEQEHQNLTPIQQLARLSAIPGISPQAIQSFSDLARQQARGQALIESQNKKQAAPSPFPQQQQGILGQQNAVPSITKEKPLEQIQKGYIPPTREEKDAIAGEAYNANPAFFNNDPQKALQWADDKAAQEEKIQEAYQQQHKNLTEIQNKVVERLGAHSKQLGVEIPANTYSKIEDKAIQATKPKSEGGEGLTEQQAMKKYGEELDAVSREYEDINALGNATLPLRPAKKTLTAIETLRNKFKKRDDLRNFADKLEAQNGLSPSFAYALADPVKEHPKINSTIKQIPDIKSKPLPAGRGLLVKAGVLPGPEEVRNKTLDISRQLLPAMKEGGSPQSVAYELQKKGYDPSVWIEYLNQHTDDLTGLQIDQLSKLDSPSGRFNDWWLQAWSGIE